MTVAMDHMHLPFHGLASEIRQHGRTESSWLFNVNMALFNFGQTVIKASFLHMA
jgi:hypothetical protein